MALVLIYRLFAQTNATTLDKKNVQAMGINHAVSMMLILVWNGLTLPLAELIKPVQMVNVLITHQPAKTIVAF